MLLLFLWYTFSSNTSRSSDFFFFFKNGGFNTNFLVYQNVTSQTCGGLEIGSVVFLSPQWKAARLHPSSVMELTRQHNGATFAFSPLCICVFFFYLQWLGVKQMKRAAPLLVFHSLFYCGSSEGSRAERCLAGTAERLQIIRGWLH